MLPDRVSNPGPLTYESGALPIALRGPARFFKFYGISKIWSFVSSTCELTNIYISQYIGLNICLKTFPRIHQLYMKPSKQTAMIHG